jgi:negative regulator of flagellin synthesis FlgM
MIDGVGKSGPGRVDLSRADQGGAAVPVSGISVRGREGGVESAVFELVSGGAPIDGAKVAAIRAAIAEGRYPVDAGKIAERMIALDLPQGGR